MAGGLWDGNRRLLMHQASGSGGQLGRPRGASWTGAWGSTGVGVGTIKAVRSSSS